MAYSHRLFGTGTLLLVVALAGCDPKMSPQDSGGGDPDLSIPAADMAEPAAADPVLTAVDPASGTNAGGTVLTLTGDNFNPNATVTIGGAAAQAVNVESKTTIRATTPAKAGACGAADIVVRNPSGKSVTRGDLFRYLSSKVGFHDVVSLQTTVATPRTVVAVDINKDGKLDLVSLHSGTGRGFFIHAGNGDGSFQMPVKVATGASPYGLAVADVNKDTRLDVLVANNADNNVGVHLQNADGTFANPINVTVGAAPYEVAVADVNGDGNPDFVAANNGSRNVSIRLGMGNGMFMSPAMNPDLNVVQGTVSVILPDMNGDSKPDIVASGTSGQGGVSVRLNNGNGTFADATTVDFGLKPWGVVAADFNGDGKMDLATANQSDSTVSVRLGAGNGKDFNDIKTFQLPTGAAPRGLRAADVDGDGRQDLIVANYGVGSVSLLLGRAEGDFAAGENLPMGSQPSAVVVGDFDGDGITDLAATNQDTMNLALRLGKCQ